MSNATSYVQGDGTVITATPQSINVQGAFQTTVQVGVSSANASNALALSVSGLPSGVNASFAPATVTGSGSSVLTLASSSSIAVGSYPFAIVGTSANGGTDQSPALTLNVSQAPPASPDFSIAVAGPTAPIHAGQSASYTLSMTSQNGFAADVSFACSGLPAGATCNFGSNPLMVNGSNSSETLQIVTTGQTASLMGSSLGGSALAFLCFGGFSVFGMCLTGASTPRKFPALMVLLTAVVLMGVGCGGTAASPAPPPPAAVTPSGTYNVTVTATSASLQHTAVAQIVVQ
jgi:hypothetical protein